MISEKDHNFNDSKDGYMVWFFAGGETRDDSFNVFTGSFIRFMKHILENEFGYIKGIYYKLPMMNVIWALNHAQKPIPDPENYKIILAATKQITCGYSRNTQVTIISSSSGSVVAAQTACYLAEKNRNHTIFTNPFHLVLGASMISPESVLFRQLIKYQQEGIIGNIIHDEIQDKGDNSFGVGGLTRSEAYRNAFGLMFPIFSRKFKRPSFLNTHPVKGHIHRRRSQSVQKAYDYINLILIKHKLAGDHVMERAIEVVRNKIH